MLVDKDTFKVDMVVVSYVLLRCKLTIIRCSASACDRECLCCTGDMTLSLFVRVCAMQQCVLLHLHLLSCGFVHCS